MIIAAVAWAWSGTTSAPATSRTAITVACPATPVAMRTESGRGIVLWQNGIDMHNLLSSDDPFIQAALAL